MTSLQAAPALDAGRTGIGLRIGSRFLRRDPRTPVESFGFHVHEPASRARVQEIVGAFFTGYNAGLESADPATIRDRCGALPEVLQPFAFEGSGMGYGARGLLDRGARPQRFAAHVERVGAGWRFLYVIGLGIWTARFGPRQTARVADRLGIPSLTGLLYDGFGFASGFFHLARDPHAHRRLATLPAEMHGDAGRGYGRSLWFVFRDDAAGLVAAVEAMPEAWRGFAVTGIGLAIVFTAVDDLPAASERLASLPRPWQRDLERGARLALYVRHTGQPQALERWIAAAGPAAGTWRAHLEHAERGHAANVDRPDYLTAFTEAC